MTNLSRCNAGRYQEPHQRHITTLQGAFAPDAASSCSNLPGSVRARTLCAMVGTSTGLAVMRNTACHVGATLAPAAGACSSRRSRRAAPACTRYGAQAAA